MRFFHLSAVIFLFHFSQPICDHFCIVSSSSGWSHALSQSAASNSATHHRLSASTLPFDLNFFRQKFHNLHSLLPPHFFFRGILMHALSTLQVVLSEQGEDSCPAILSPCSCSVRPASYTPTFQRGSSASAGLSFAVLDLVLVQNLFLHFLCQLLPALIHQLLTHTSPFPHFFSLPQETVWLVFHLFSGPSFHFLLFFLYLSLLHLWTFGHMPLASLPLPPSLSICEQSQFCLTLCPTVLSAVGLASSCAHAFTVMPSATF